MIIFKCEDFKMHKDEGKYWAEMHPSLSKIKSKEIFIFINYLNQPERSKREEVCSDCKIVSHFIADCWDSGCRKEHIMRCSEHCG